MDEEVDEESEHGSKSEKTESDTESVDVTRYSGDHRPGRVKIDQEARQELDNLETGDRHGDALRNGHAQNAQRVVRIHYGVDVRVDHGHHEDGRLRVREEVARDEVGDEMVVPMEHDKFGFAEDDEQRVAVLDELAGDEEKDPEGGGLAGVEAVPLTDEAVKPAAGL